MKTPLSLLRSLRKNKSTWLVFVLFLFINFNAMAAAAAGPSNPLPDYEKIALLNWDNWVGNCNAVVAFSGSSTPTNATCSCNGTTTLSGVGNEQQVWNYFITNGLTAAQTAGIMGNLQQESGFDPEEIEGGGDSQNPASSGSNGWGLAQWTPGTDVEQDQTTYKISGNIYDLLTQLNIIWAQLGGSSPEGHTDILQQIKTMNNPDAVAKFFNAEFEGGSDPGGVRESDAEKILSQYGGASSAVSANPGSTGGCSSSSSSPDCTTATGDTKILCEAKKYDPVDYVWGGGHAGGAAYHQACPTIQANDSACGLDCSGLVSVAVYDAFGNDNSWTTYTIVSDSANWKQISFSQLQPGDLIEPDPGHVEIVDHVQGPNVFTFGAHSSTFPQPQQVGPAEYTNAENNSSYNYFRYIGEGSNG